MTIEFFRTRMGQQFYEGTAPRIATALEALVKEMRDSRGPADDGINHDAIAELRASIEAKETTSTACVLVVSAKELDVLHELVDIAAGFDDEQKEALGLTEEEWIALYDRTRSGS